MKTLAEVTSEVIIGDKKISVRKRLYRASLNPKYLLELLNNFKF